MHFGKQLLLVLEVYPVASDLPVTDSHFDSNAFSFSKYLIYFLLSLQKANMSDLSISVDSHSWVHPFGM